MQGALPVLAATTILIIFVIHTIARSCAPSRITTSARSCGFWPLSVAAVVLIQQQAQACVFYNLSVRFCSEFLCCLALQVRAGPQCCLSVGVLLSGSPIPFASPSHLLAPLGLEARGSLPMGSHVVVEQRPASARTPVAPHWPRHGSVLSASSRSQVRSLRPFLSAVITGVVPWHFFSSNLRWGQREAFPLLLRTVKRNVISPRPPGVHTTTGPADRAQL
ncbi:hypothetical protein HJG60_009816 [Phyllostomus discolor]|uniref:Secreted protein n=1 Tax=Phyllostomus discolor TaxID=89673 RepID=A0A834B9J8_9CHIR|nr:hypothetical protein HJG60_009816 [Phyllostomus discolor]